MKIDKNKSLLPAAAELRRHAEEQLRAKTADRHPLTSVEQKEEIWA
jgi:hypothetical protein